MKEGPSLLGNSEGVDKMFHLNCLFFCCPHSGRATYCLPQNEAFVSCLDPEPGLAGDFVLTLPVFTMKRVDVDAYLVQRFVQVVQKSGL